MILGRIIAAPFTFGVMIGLTVARTVVAAAESGITTITKTGDYAIGQSDLKKINKQNDG